MYGYVVNIESSQPLKRLSITELGFDKIVENNLIKVENNQDTNNYSFNLRPIQAFNPNNVLSNNTQSIKMTTKPDMSQNMSQNMAQNNKEVWAQNNNNFLQENSKGFSDVNINLRGNKVSPIQIIGSDIKFPVKHPADFEVIWHKLSYTLSKGLSKSRSNILKNLNGYFRSSEVTAIMGPSGAGKSTLLEIICGRRRQGVTGEIRIRGAYALKVGFVPQDNHLLELLSVRESFVLASRLINVRDKSFDHLAIADRLIRRFGLDSVAETKAKSCSGGQRKRLSIALEIISKPNLLILDEPTTGLDSPSCSQVMQILNELVSDKRFPTAIVTTIHQPSVALFNGFSRVYVLSLSGRCIYLGTPQSLVPTLTKCGVQCDPFTSPADYIIEVAAGDYGPAPIKSLIMEAESQDLELLVTAGTIPLADASRHLSHPFWSHLKILYIRSQIILYRDPFLTVIRIIMAIFSATCLAIMFGREVGKTSGCPPRMLELYATPLVVLSKRFEYEINMVMQNVSLLFMGIMVGFLSGLTPTLLNFPKEMNVFFKEYHNGWYSCLPYYIAKVFSDIPLQILTPLIYTLITYFYSSQPLQMFRFSSLLLIAILLSLLAQSIGECCGAIWMHNQNSAVVAGGIIPLPMILFGGFLVKISRMPVYLRPGTWFSFLRFAFEAMMITTYGFNRCEYSYQQFLTTVNVSAITKPFWAQTLPLMIDFVDTKRNPSMGPRPELTEEQSVKRLYRVFGGSTVKEKGIDFNTSLILNYFDVDDYQLYISLGILIGYMVVLKVLTYYVLLAKLHSTK